MKLVLIRTGNFKMGSRPDELSNRSNEWRDHDVTIDCSFYMGKYEVTQEQFTKVIGVNPSSNKGCPDCPVEYVSWDEAKKFIDKLNERKDEFEYRLPTEAEWEYACRSGARIVYLGNPGKAFEKALKNERKKTGVVWRRVWRTSIRWHKGTQQLGIG
jgi:formylglycine-generating enzyme required for sulfatase activity